MKKPIQLLLPAIIVATFFSCQHRLLPPDNLPITIDAANVTSGDLMLSDGGITGANRGDTITWSINAKNVSSFRIKKKGFFDHNIFENPPGNTSSQTLKAYIKKGLWFNYKYDYSIIWTDTLKTQHTYDPLIYIKPTAR